MGQDKGIFFLWRRDIKFSCSGVTARLAECRWRAGITHWSGTVTALACFLKEVFNVKAVQWIFYDALACISPYCKPSDGHDEPTCGVLFSPPPFCGPRNIYQVADIAARVTITLICAIMAAEGDVGQGLV